MTILQWVVFIFCAVMLVVVLGLGYWDGVRLRNQRDEAWREYVKALVDICARQQELITLLKEREVLSGRAKAVEKEG